MQNLPNRDRGAQRAFDLMGEWQQELVEWLESDLGRRLTMKDYESIDWDQKTESLTVARAPLINEIVGNNLARNRSRQDRPEHKD